MTARLSCLAAAALLMTSGALLAGAPAAVAVEVEVLPPVGPAAVDPKYPDAKKLQDLVLGAMAIEPVTGDLESNIVFTTAGGCPYGSNSVTRIYGPKLPGDGQNVIGNTGLYGFGSPPADRMVAPMTITLQEVVERQEKPVELAGKYRVRMQCQLEFPDTIFENFGVYEGFLEIRDGKYTALTTRKNLPATPSPRTGQDAYAGYEASKRVPPPPLIEQQGSPIAVQNAANATDDSKPSGTAVAAVVGGLLVLGLTPVAWNARRRGRTTGRT